MTKRMLIDATHSEETRIAVVDDTRLLELDFETARIKQIKGNIYLAKVMRIEPSLQAAFVEYGGGKQGFLSFMEIHPDYYRIPIADREALIAAANEEARRAAEAEAAEDEAEDARESRGKDTPSAPEGESEGEHADRPATPQDVGASDSEEEEIRRPAFNPKRHYKIQEVIKKHQVMLVQVTKEERGSKGAALTTYLSLAGRYCVLMPNSPRSGGVSRKIGDGKDRRRLREILDDLQIPQGISVILRTAGADRTKVEIRRDYEYLVRLWDEIRQKTLDSVAPALIHEEGNLLKRALRDLYSRDTEEILVEGDEAYKEAKTFIKMLMPSHARRVKPYKDPQAHLFNRFSVEKQIDAIFQPVAQLPSGGYIVINQTEALVSIDVNSGRAIRERHIEETALKTNLEAADEIARQLRLRDLAGLIVVDFIDMEDRRNNRVVEHRLKDALKDDRARLQLGRISGFGLLEMSRQRLRPALHEISTTPCAHCQGTGYIRSVESLALQALRAVEEEVLHEQVNWIKLFVPAPVAFFIFNQKRAVLTDLEQRFNCAITLQDDPDLASSSYRVESDAPKSRNGRGRRLLPLPKIGQYDDASDETDEEIAASEREEADNDNVSPDGEPRRRRRRRRGRGRDRDDRGIATTSGDREENTDATDNTADSASDAEAPKRDAAAPSAASGEDDDDDNNPRRRRRGRRGGRGRSRREGGDESAAASDDTGDTPTPAPSTTKAITAAPIVVDVSSIVVEPKPAPFYTAPVAAVVETPAPEPKKPAIRTVPVGVELVDAPPAKPRRGWWRRGSSDE